MEEKDEHLQGQTEETEQKENTEQKGFSFKDFLTKIKRKKEGDTAELDEEALRALFEAAQKRLGELEAENEKLKNEAALLKDAAARSRADYFNLRTRTEREREMNAKLAAEDAIKNLMPVFENLGRVSGAIAEKESSLAKGISMVIKQFAESMCKLGLEFIPTEGDFDPSVHEAVGMAEVDDPALDGKITDTISIGYKIAGRVIKAPQVRVGQYNK